MTKKKAVNPKNPKRPLSHPNPLPMRPTSLATSITQTARKRAQQGLHRSIKENPGTPANSTAMGMASLVSRSFQKNPPKDYSIGGLFLFPATQSRKKPCLMTWAIFFLRSSKNREYSRLVQLSGRACISIISDNSAEGIPSMSLLLHPSTTNWIKTPFTSPFFALRVN
jgi:hypothetical protein